jgi:hypothetical protein
MKKSIKIGAMSLLLVLLPGSLGIGTVYSSSGGNTNVNEENATYQDNNVVADKSLSVITTENTVDKISKSISYDYPVGSAYPTSVNYSQFYDGRGWASGTLYFSDIYPIGNGKVRVWYYGELSLK